MNFLPTSVLFVSLSFASALSYIFTFVRVIVLSFLLKSVMASSYPALEVIVVWVCRRFFSAKPLKRLSKMNRSLLLYQVQFMKA